MSEQPSEIKIVNFLKEKFTGLYEFITNSMFQPNLKQDTVQAIKTYADKEGFLQKLSRHAAKRTKQVFRRGVEDLQINEISNMIAAEAGELAGICHKIRTEYYPHTLENKEVKQELADEMADVLINLSMLAAKAEIDLEEAAREKFNEVSERTNYQIRL